MRLRLKHFLPNRRSCPHVNFLSFPLATCSLTPGSVGYLAHQPTASASPSISPHAMPVPQGSRRALPHRKKSSQKQTTLTEAEAAASSPEKGTTTIHDSHTPAEGQSAPVSLDQNAAPGNSTICPYLGACSGTVRYARCRHFPSPSPHRPSQASYQVSLVTFSYSPTLPHPRLTVDSSNLPFQEIIREGQSTIVRPFPSVHSLLFCKPFLNLLNLSCRSHA
jgi:hypothetical protein